MSAAAGKPTLVDRVVAAHDALKVIKAFRIALRALEWYADERNWQEDDWGCRSLVQPPDYGRGGQKARNAIKRIESALR